MADYSSLWTSSRDPEFQQIKKVKQLTERHLAMHVSNVEKSHRRSMKKTRDQIRESITTLEELEKEKEKRARQILATYFKHQRMQQAANVWKLKFQNRRSSEAANSNNNNSSARPSLLQLFQNVPPNSSPNKSTGTLATESVTGIPRIRFEVPRNSDPDDNIASVIQSVEEANGELSKDTLLTPHDGKHFSTNSDKGGYDQKSRRDSIKKKSFKSKEQSDAGCLTKSGNSADSFMSQNRGSQGRIQTEQNRSPLRAKMGDRTKRMATNSKVLMTHTFPYVYHSHGEKPCPRYGLFRECTDYDPFLRSSSSRRPSMMAPSRKASVFSTTTNVSKPEVPNRRVSFNRVATAIKVANALYQH